jgi:hypothetical protein
MPLGTEILVSITLRISTSVCRLERRSVRARAVEFKAATDWGVLFVAWVVRKSVSSVVTPITRQV